ncbi:HAD-IA family hydrolase [Candidatus Gracilibacteria bacterium]|nr:HAD-IA family hydrolase [Candidatus Gracilibacteria bacterium]
MNNIKYIFRDFRGTIMKLDTKKYGHVTQISNIYNIPKNEIRKAVEKPLAKMRRGEITEKNFRKEFSKNINKPILKDCSKIFHTPVELYSKPYKNIINLILKLKKLGYKNIILSDDFKAQTKNVKKTGLHKYFDDKILSCEVGLSKFDDTVNGTTKIFEYALKKYGIQGSEAVFVDDLEKNCIVANKLGIKTIVAQNSKQTIRDLKNILKI